MKATRHLFETSRATMLGLLLSMITGGVAGQLTRDPDYLQGRQAWQQKDWARASQHLSRFIVAGADRANYEVLFWLGTSWCRILGNEKDGVDVLEWGLSFQQMPEAARPQFKVQRDLCLQWYVDAAVARSLPGLLVSSVGGSPATVKATGKTYVVGGDKGSLAAYPVRVKKPISIEVLEARLVERPEADRAIAVATSLAPKATVVASKYTVLSSLSGHSSISLRRIGDVLDVYVEFLSSTYGLKPPPWFMTVYLVPSIPDLQRLAEKLHGLDASPLTLGYAFENDQSILAMLTSSEAAGTVLHEIFHLMVRGTYASAPQWLDEGIASLYETSTRAGGEFYGEPNWRSPVFKEMRMAFPNVTLRDVITSPWFSDEPSLHAALKEPVLTPEEQAYFLAYARLFVLYLQDQGLLVRAFNSFSQRQRPDQPIPAKEQAVALLQSAFNGEPIEVTEKKFMSWVPKVLDPNRRIYAGKQIAKELPTQSLERELPKSVDR